ncbi:LysR family transcriptional regulator [Paucibacter sp. XJ19-41]|uniref:LysR family transcriptional regulator n=1 Tax=Paucibacter sp. XJ19-41 TaxID=2927824 RepID=UPI00234BC76F|nr:LysR family transcriptional regulator [Paucibacter sp. XJ19-41]MDC6169816.1 LysR family transcriptional regulator [Paucibacter sp. XJ19-41]
MDLQRIDLNLLLLFDTLYRERSVTGAAGRMALSPSAVSHALARLRQALGDELFVRSGPVMLPTALAERIAPGIKNALGTLGDTLGSLGRFDPASSQRSFVFAATDYTALVLLPRLSAYLAEAAPNLHLQVVQASRKVPVRELAAGEIDFALGYTEAEPQAGADGIRELDWFSDRYVVIGSRAQAEARGRLTLKKYLAARHVVVSPWGQTRGAIDHELEQLGHRRQVAMHVPSVLAAPFIVASTDLLMTVPRLAAELIARAAPIVVYPAPFPAADYTLKAYFHAGRISDPACRWMADTIVREMAPQRPGR